jgi:hypothetical protein
MELRDMLGGDGADQLRYSSVHHFWLLAGFSLVGWLIVSGSLPAVPVVWLRVVLLLRQGVLVEL